MNYIKFQCYKDYGYTDKDCLESKMAREDFRFLLEKIHLMALDATMEKLKAMNGTQIEEELYVHIGQREDAKPWKLILIDKKEKLFRLLVHYATSSISDCSSTLQLERKLVNFI